MSDEEKKAIDHIKESPTYRELILLRVIEKQQKEIEENKKYIVQLTDDQYRKLVDIIRADTCKEWKDKIKAKIEEVKDGTFDAEIILHQLLEKE